MFKKFMVVLCLIQLLIVSQLTAQSFEGRTTLNFRGGVWRLNKEHEQTIVRAVVGSEYVHADFNYSIGSGIDIYYWSSDALAIGMTIGALTRGESNDHINTGCDSRTNCDHDCLDIGDYHRNVTIIPLTASVRLNILTNSHSPFRPYLSGGGGAYWGIDSIHESGVWIEDDTRIGDQVESTSEVIEGGYLGGGVDIIIWRRGLLEFKSIRESDLGRSWFGNILGIGFGLNIDYRYHFINFERPVWDRKHYSGSELTFGFNLIFGKEKPKTTYQIR